MLNIPVEVTSSSTKNSTEKNGQKTLQVYNMHTAVFDYWIFKPSAFKSVRTSTNFCSVEFEQYLFYIVM